MIKTVLHNRASNFVIDKEKELLIEAIKRLYYISPLLNNNCKRLSEQNYIDIKSKTGLSKSSLYRWFTAYQNSEGDITSLYPIPSYTGKGTTKISQDQEAIIVQGINNILCCGSSFMFFDIYLEVKKLCRSAKLKIPHDSTVFRRLERLGISMQRLSKNEFLDRLKKGDFLTYSYDSKNHLLTVVPTNKNFRNIKYNDQIIQEHFPNKYLTLVEDFNKELRNYKIVPLPKKKNSDFVQYKFLIDGYFLKIHRDCQLSIFSLNYGYIKTWDMSKHFQSRIFIESLITLILLKKINLVSLFSLLNSINFDFKSLLDLEFEDYYHQVLQKKFIEKYKSIHV